MIADVDPIVRLWGGITDQQICTVLLALADQNDIGINVDIEHLLHNLIAADSLILAGGIRVQDGERVILPGCCTGVEDWREQVQGFLSGQGWLGHDPAPWVELRPDGVRLWSDGGLDLVPATEVFSVDIPRSQIDSLESSICTDLKEFLSALHDWSASRMTGADTLTLLDRIDRTLRVSRLNRP